MRKGDPELDPKGLIAESYRIEGISESECRSIFLDWALSLPVGTDTGPALRVLVERHQQSDPDHPMTEVMRQEFEWELLPLTEEELAELAGITGDALKFATQVVVAQKREIAGIDPASSTPGSLEQAKETMVQLVEDQAQDMRRYRLVVNALEAKGGDPELVAKLRAYQVALIADQARLADRTSILHHARKWLLSWDGGAKVLLYLGVLAGSLVALILLARIVRGWSNLMLKRAKVSRLLKAFLEQVFFWMTIIVGFLMGLATLGVDIGPLVALIGGASFIIAFAMQDTLSNFAAGLMIMIYQPFDEGDFGSVAGIAGEVRAVSVVATTIRTPDNNEETTRDEPVHITWRARNEIVYPVY